MRRVRSRLIKTKPFCTVPTHEVGNWESGFGNWNFGRRTRVNCRLFECIYVEPSGTKVSHTFRKAGLAVRSARIESQSQRIRESGLGVLNPRITGRKGCGCVFKILVNKNRKSARGNAQDSLHIYPFPGTSISISIFWWARTRVSLLATAGAALIACN